MRILSKFGALALGIFIAAAAVAEPVDITHLPMELNRAELVVAGPSGEVSYTPEELENIGFKRLTTITPWRDQPAAFDGVLLTDLLAANGLLDAPSVRVVAENDYAVEITAETWQRWPILIATRVNGRAHTRRQRGPIQFILPLSEDRATGTVEAQKNWVWMAARIEADF